MERSTLQKRIGLAIIVMPCLLFSMDLTVLNLALPHIASAFHATNSQLLWIADISTFFLAASLIAIGKLGDRVGHRRMLLLGVTLFGLGAIGAAFAPNAATLIGARALMGIAAATIAPCTLALIHNLFPDPKQRISAIGVWAASLGIGGALGPLLGGVLLQNFWWGSVFLMNIPIVVLILALGPLFLPKSQSAKKEPIDLVSVLLLIATILPLVYAVQTFSGASSRTGQLLMAAAGVLLGGVFAWRQLRAKYPLIEPSLFRSKQFRIALGMQFTVFFVNFPVFVFMSQYLQSVKEIPAILAGVWLLPAGIGFILGSLLSGKLVGRFKSIPAVGGGFVVSAIGFCLLALMPHYGMAVMVAGLLLYAIGLAPIIAISANLTLSAAPAAKAGLASGIGQSAVQLGGAFGVAILGSLGALVYTKNLESHTATGAYQQFASHAQENVSSALQAAKQLPPTLAGEVEKIVGQAFTRGLVVVCLASAIIVLVAAIIIAKSGVTEPNNRS